MKLMHLHAKKIQDPGLREYNYLVYKTRNVWIFLGPPLITLACSFGLTLDSINTFKLLVASIVLGIATFVAFKNLSDKNAPITLFLSITILLLILGLAIPILFSGSPVLQQIFGVSGRNLGFLHYLILICFLLICVQNYSKKIASIFLDCLIYTGILETIYGLTQYAGYDFTSWKNPNGWITGTFGNPNYLSSFLAISSIGVLWKFSSSQNLAIKFICVFFILLQIYLIFLTKSSQGLGLILFIISSFSISLTLRKSKTIGVLIAILCSISFVFILIGFLQFGPLKGFVYQESISYRGDYWRAGMQMFKHNFLTGVGLDSYGDYYRLYRDETAAYRRGFETTSNSAHNLLIDLSATGGVVLLFAFVLLNVYILFSICKNLKVVFDKDLANFSLILIWFTYILQALVSINVLSLAIWGWVAAGLILGNFCNNEIAKTKRNISGKFFLRFQIILTISVLLLIIPLVYRDYRMAQSFKKNSLSLLEISVLSFPKDVEQMVGVSLIYEKNGDEVKSLQILRKALNVNNNSYRAWNLVSKNSTATPEEKNLATIELKKLDPIKYRDSREISASN